MADKPIKTPANEFGSGTAKGAPGVYDHLPEPKGLLKRSSSPTGQPEKLFEPDGAASSPKKG